MFQPASCSPNHLCLQVLLPKRTLMRISIDQLDLSCWTNRSITATNLAFSGSHAISWQLAARSNDESVRTPCCTGALAECVRTSVENLKNSMPVAWKKVATNALGTKQGTGAERAKDNNYATQCRTMWPHLDLGQGKGRSVINEKTYKIGIIIWKFKFVYTAIRVLFVNIEQVWHC